MSEDALVVANEARVVARQAMEQADLAIKIATTAASDATSALDTSNRNSIELMGLSVGQERTERTLNDHKVRSEERHVEQLAAIEGVKSADKARARQDSLHEEKLKELASSVTELSGKSLAKVGGAAAGGMAVLVAVGMAFAGLINAITPVAPAILQAKYATPVVVPLSAVPIVLPPPAVSH